MKRVRWAVRGVVVYFAGCVLGYGLTDLIFRLMLRANPQFNYIECAERVGQCWLGAVVLAVFVAIWGHPAKLRSQLLLAAAAGVASETAVVTLLIVAVVLDALGSSTLLKIYNMGGAEAVAGGMSAAVASIWLGWQRRRLASEAKEGTGSREVR